MNLEASGAAAWKGHLLVVSDQTNHLFVFTPRGKLAQVVKVQGLPSTRLKLEGIAVDPRSSTVYLTGAHYSTSGNPVKVAARSQLFSFRIQEAGGKVAVVPDSVRRYSLVASLKDKGLYGEAHVYGLTYDAAKHALLVGLRLPFKELTFYVVKLPREEPRPALTQELSIGPITQLDGGTIESYRFRLSGMAHDAALGGAFVLATTEGLMEDFYGNRVWFVPDGDASPFLLLDTFDSGLKAEGIVVLPGAHQDERDLAIVYDNDGDDTGIPSTFRMIPGVTVQAGTGQHTGQEAQR